MKDFSPIFEMSVMITGFVMVMMLLIEYLNVSSEGRWNKRIFRSKFGQVVTCSFLGMIPGCLGGFAVVSMYTHGLVSFGAMTAAMIASSGDEAFVMLAMFPQKAVLIQLGLFAAAVAVGLLTDLFFRNFHPVIDGEHHFELHSHHSHESSGHPRHMSFARGLLTGGLVLFIARLLMGEEDGSELVLMSEQTLNLIFAVVAVLTLVIVLTADDHFLEEHLWNHVIKRHFLKIFLWTLGTLIVVHIIENFIDVQAWISSNQFSVLLIAVLIGFIPESGPHLIFVTLFAGGSLPLSILLASSIVQDGHSGIPLLAESRRSFILTKSINAAVGLLAGAAGILMNF